MQKLGIFFFTLFFWTLIFSTSAQAVQINAFEVIKRTQNHSLSAKSIRLNQEIAKEGIKESKSQYDVYLNGEVSYTKDESERSSPVFGTTTTNTQYNVEASQLIPTGTQLSVGFYNSKDTSDSAFVTNNKLYNSQLGFGVSQDLYLGFQNRKAVSLAKANHQAEELGVQSDLLDLTYSNLALYWQYYLYHQLEKIDREALSAALRLLRTNRQKMSIGLIEEADIYAFRANADLKRGEVMVAQSNLIEKESDLRVAIQILSEDLEVAGENTSPKEFPELRTLADQVLLNNPQYQKLKKQLQAQNIMVSMKKNAMLPEIDLVGSLVLNGIDPTYNQATSEIADGNTVLSGGINLSFPLQNRKARAQARQEKLRQKQLLYTLKEVESRLINKIKEAYHQHDRYKARLSYLKNAVFNQRKKWEGEIERYDQGRSDPDLVITYQDDYLNTKKLYAQALAEYQLSKLKVDYVLGDIKP